MNRWIRVSDAVCECGHDQAAHLEWSWVWDAEQQRPRQQWYATGQGMCSKCSCQRFTALS